MKLPWIHATGILAISISLSVGLLRTLTLGTKDPFNCSALIERGSWLDSSRGIWQPDGCILHSYSPSDGSTCLESRRVIFIGDSTTRKLFFQFAHVLDPTLPTAPPNDMQKHSDHVLVTQNQSEISFFWDPFLNTSIAHHLDPSGESVDRTRRPALLILGSGLWYLRYSTTSNGVSGWLGNTEGILNALGKNNFTAADQIVLLPIQQVVSSKLSRDRATTIWPSDIDEMNLALHHRLRLAGNSSMNLSSALISPLVFNDMLEPSNTEDGLHFSDATVRAQANILLNAFCNDRLPKVPPFNKTCCFSYPQPFPLQLFLLIVAAAWGLIAYFLFLRRQASTRSGHLPILVFSITVVLMYVADRTGLWLKEQKHFDEWTFTFLCFLTLAVGLASIKRDNNDLGILNRGQTGWMQLIILIYHYCGGSKVSGIYNPVRVLVASYLFMTGYGHTTYYLRKAEFGFHRILQILMRLNLLTIALSYTMNTDYLSYYFAPLVSMWFLVIYTTLAIYSRYNHNTAFVLFKITLSAALVTLFFLDPWPLESCFRFLARVFGTHWSAREWAFRVKLDIWIVYFGMLTAIAVIKIRDHNLTTHPRWSLVANAAIGGSGIIMVLFFMFELAQESKFTYNLWHPYISFLPVLAFICLRNASVLLRSSFSRAFAFIGKCSLETFIMQYHLWLAGDSKGILIIIPGPHWRPANFILQTIVFIYLSDRVANATSDLAARFCDLDQSLPTHQAGENQPPATKAYLGVPWNLRAEL
ncbi:10 TM acyl transferase domain found in Cas1p-domain-containing protein [Infundibulicybe gibba]|nr:10 TM acyl transferase domain found in Cas1p-domain-containing protein [Infundibulicybe gibba]